MVQLSAGDSFEPPLLVAALALALQVEQARGLRLDGQGNLEETQWGTHYSYVKSKTEQARRRSAAADSCVLHNTYYLLLIAYCLQLTAH